MKGEEAVLALFQEKGWTLALAESCTGGALATRLVSVPGTSVYFLGGVVTYANLAKETLLDIPKQFLENYGAVSKQVTQEMALSVKRRLHSDIGIAITGVAGPSGGSLEKPVGTVWIAIAGLENRVTVRSFFFSGTREEIFVKTVDQAITELLLQDKF